MSYKITKQMASPSFLTSPLESHFSPSPCRDAEFIDIFLLAKENWV